ncbi:MAG: ABC transporter ATP-binding protein [Erysipelotrichaceae bacterium]|nr:ABC transporter ATP-binding protein [Erysipelotrichaceae bacterium]
MKRLFVYLKKYTKESLLAPLFKLLEALMDLIVPLVIATIINHGIGNNDGSLIWKSFAFLILLAVLGMLFSFTAQWFAAKASVGFASDVRQKLFDHIQELSYTKLDQLGTDTLITRMTSDVNQLQTGVNLALRLLLRSPFIVFGAMIMAFMIDVPGALIFAVTIPVLALVVFGIMLVSIPLFVKVQSALDRLLSLTRENLSGVRVIRAFCKEEDEVKEFDKKSHILTAISEKVGRLSAIMNPATYLIVNVATVILIRQGALRVELGVLKQGDVVALYNYMAQIIVELIKLASLIITINKSLACADRIADVLDVDPGMEYRNKEIEKKDDRIVFDQVSFAYEGSKEETVTDISFAVDKGKTVGIIGGTGSGKSTVVNLLARFYDVSSGKILIDGTDVRDYSKDELLNKIGIVPQKAVLFSGTIRDNMKWGKEDATDEEIWDALTVAQARETVENKENRLDGLVEQGGRNFSGGQRQRLTIARALVKKPEILIMDDSASALDFATDYALRKAIHKLDMTVFIVSQRTSSVRNADLILVLDDGRLVGKGTHAQLMKNCEIYQEIYYSQFPEEKPEVAHA